MTKSIAHIFCFVILLLAAAWLPRPAHAANAQMQAASQSLVAKARASTDQAKALHLLEEAMVADPANAAALTGLGQHYVVMGKPKVANKYFSTALIVDPANVAALSGSANIDIANGKRDAATEKLNVLKTVCAACVETRALDAKLSNPIKTSPVGKP